MIVAIEGCIASGKSTTARFVAEALRWPVVLEQTNLHPFLADFYADPHRSALETELCFVLLHYHQLHPLDPRNAVVTDFSPAKDLIFARMNLSGDDLVLFEHVYTNLAREVQTPRLSIFLDLPIDELMRRIKKRGRPYEMGVSPAYVNRLREFYCAGLDQLGEDVRIVKLACGEDPHAVASKVLAIVRASQHTGS